MAKCDDKMAKINEANIRLCSLDKKVKHLEKRSPRNGSSSASPLKTPRKRVSPGSKGSPYTPFSSQSTAAFSRGSP